MSFFQAVKRFWRWKGVDYLIEAAIILVLLAGFFRVYHANQVLTEDGCRSYYRQFKEGVNLSEVVLVGKRQRKMLLRGPAVGENVSLVENFSRKNFNFSNSNTGVKGK